MKQIKLNIYDYSTISIYTDLSEVVNQFEKGMVKIAKTIPISDMKIYEFSNEINNIKNSMIILKGNNNNINFDIYNNTMIVSIKDDKIRIVDYIYMLLEMFANDLLNEKKYLIHSSSLKYDDDKSILLVGDGNSGKSTLAYNLMLNYDMKLISNDHTLIGKEDEFLTTFSGTKPLELRYGVIDKYFPSFSHLIEGCSSEDYWNKKVIINDYINQSMIASDDKTIVTDIYQVDLCENGSCFLKTKDNIDQRLFLYEHLSKQLKGTYNLITGFDYPMPSVENKNNLKILNEEIKDYLNNTEVHICKGSLDELSKVMVRKLEKK